MKEYECQITCVDSPCLFCGGCQNFLTGKKISIFKTATTINGSSWPKEDWLQQVVFVRQTEGQVPAIGSFVLMTGCGCSQTGGGL